MTIDYLKKCVDTYLQRNFGPAAQKLYVWINIRSMRLGGTEWEQTVYTIEVQREDGSGEIQVKRSSPDELLAAFRSSVIPKIKEWFEVP